MVGRKAPTVALAMSTIAIAFLGGCASPGGGNSGTITYEADGKQKTASFTPSNVNCNDRGAVSLSYPDKPLNSVSITLGSTAKAEAWVYDEQLIVFTSDDLTVTELSDDGTTEYVISAQMGEVAVTSLPEASSDALPDVDTAIRDADRFTGTLDVRLRCDPAS